MENKDNNEDELPKLNIEQENEFKKLKLFIEHGASFFGNIFYAFIPIKNSFCIFNWDEDKCENGIISYFIL